MPAPRSDILKSNEAYTDDSGENRVQYYFHISINIKVDPLLDKILF